jgi:hypothetical protein
MTDEEKDLVLAAWARDYAAGKTLPEKFSRRLRLSVRRSRRAFRLKLTAVIALSAASIMLVVGLTGRTMVQVKQKAAIVAANDDVRKECVAGWALFGVFRECFRRGKSNKRKEEE